MPHDMNARFSSEDGAGMKDPDLKVRTAGEVEARQVAEEAREAEWKQPSFLRELYLGNFHVDLIHPFPGTDAVPRPEFLRFYEAMERFLIEKVDSDRIDREGKIPPEVVNGLREMGAFGMKIPAQYGG